MFSASEPAMPTVPAPAPDVDVAPVLETPSPEAEFIAVSRARPSEVTLPPDGTVARTVTFARSIATAAPMPTEPLVTALPSAVAFASVSDVAFRLTMPPATRPPRPAVADELVLAMFTAMAAATLTGVPEVVAGGVVAPPEPEPPGTESPRLRCAAVCAVTFGVPEPAPLALACALVSVDDACSAVTVAVPVAVRLRPTEAVAS